MLINRRWSQFATTSNGSSIHLAFLNVFTKHGAVMLASVLNSDRAYGSISGLYGYPNLTLVVWEPWHILKHT